MWQATSDTRKPFARQLACLLATLLSVLYGGTPMSARKAHADVSGTTASVFWGFDPIFGVNGVSQFPFKSIADVGLASYLRPDGKLITRTQFYSVSKNGVYPVTSTLMLVSSQGQFELSRTSITPEWTLGIQSSGKLLSISNLTSNVTLRRYDANLNVDFSFSSDGWAQLSTTLVNRRGFIQADDKILIAADLQDPVSQTLSSTLQLVRLNADGARDMSFSASISNTQVGDILGFDPAGRLVVSGADCIARVFGVDGAYLGTIGPFGCSTNGNFSAFTPHPNGGFMWFGSLVSASSTARLYRSSNNQGLDNTFGVNGAVTITLPSTLYFPCCGYGVVAQPDGKVIVSTPVLKRSGADIRDAYLLVARLNANGSPDPEFGSNGYVLFSQSINLGQPGVFFTQDQKILIAGVNYNSRAVTILRLAPFTLSTSLFLPTLSHST